MVDDPIVEGIHAIRYRHAEKFNFDPEAIYRDFKAKEAASKRKLISRVQKQPRKSVGQMHKDAKSLKQKV
jgi:hypothetical protein